MGENGISFNGVISTPDRNEASVKITVMEKSRLTYVLADSSKFDNIASVTFLPLEDANIITDKLSNKKYFEKANIKEVL